MNIDELKKVIESLARVVNLSEENKKELIEHYSKMGEKEIIKDLSLKAYRFLKDKDELFSYALDIIRGINPKICPPVEEMKIQLSKMYSNVVEGNMSMEDNHRLINEELVRFTKLFNQAGIDYYIVGALPCFIKTNQPLYRYHDDIDVMINEEDMAKAAEIMASNGYEFHDDRFPSVERYNEMQQHKPPHTVMAQNPNNEFHLGFFTFRREPDQSMTVKEYFPRMENGEVVSDVLERRTDLTGTTLRYDETPTPYLGTSFKTGTVESIYAIKQYTSWPKDITDVEKLTPFINVEKLAELRTHPEEFVEIKNAYPELNTRHGR